MKLTFKNNSTYKCDYINLLLKINFSRIDETIKNLKTNITEYLW